MVRNTFFLYVFTEWFYTYPALVGDRAQFLKRGKLQIASVLILVVSLVLTSVVKGLNYASKEAPLVRSCIWQDPNGYEFNIGR